MWVQRRLNVRGNVVSVKCRQVKGLTDTWSWYRKEGGMVTKTEEHFVLHLKKCHNFGALNWAINTFVVLLKPWLED